MGIASSTFSKQRTVENFSAWVREAPQDAKAYLQTVAVKTGNVAALNGLDALDKAPPPDPAAALGEVFAQLDAAAMGALQAARVDTLGWQANGPPREPPALTGRLTMEGTTPVLTTAFGTFNVRSINPVGANDVGAFTGRVVTVKGWPDASWQPGSDARATLLAEEFAPGTGTGFVTGRASVKNGDVFIDVRPDKQVKVTDPTLKAVLSTLDSLGLVLPGEPERQGNDWVYPHAPEGYYLLAGFTNARNLTPTADTAGNVKFPLQLAHGKSLDVQLPKAQWEASTRSQRHYFYGRIENGRLEALGVTPTAGTWGGKPGFQRGAESTKFVEYAVPVDPPEWTADEAKFSF